MKRANNLIDAIADADNLRLAFYKACRGKRGKSDVLNFRDNLDDELMRLREELLKGECEWGPYHTFKVFDHKERTICAAPFRARVMQHAISNVCDPFFENYQVYDSYACRRGRGLDAALKRALSFSRAGDWYLKMDIKKYFDSIDHEVLRELLSMRFKDRTVLRIFDSIIASYETLPSKGIPIGNLTSQYFANHYLAPLDHHIKENLRYHRYVRYMDDFVIWSGTKESLIAARNEIEAFLSKRLKLQMKPVCLNACERGMTFLGYRVFPHGAGLARRSRERFRRKALIYTRLFDEERWDEAELARHMEPMLSFVRRGASRAFRERVINECGLCLKARTA
jgi:RNA-directed DNA polymerase